MLINIGYENFINGELIAVILNPDSAHVKKLRQDALEKGLLINATSGHKTRSVIVLTTNQVILSSLQTTTFRARANQKWNILPEQTDDKLS
jgi:regulator of extracellular matrix RemA (YlzA/DUF370 family)